MNPLVLVLRILLALACVVLGYLVTVWVLGLLGLPVPQQILTVIFVIVGLLAAIWVVTGGKFTWPKSE